MSVIAHNIPRDPAKLTIRPQRLDRLDAETPPSGSDRREEAHGDHEHRDGGQEDGPLSAHERTPRKPLE